MKKNLRGFSLLLLSVFTSLVCLPFAFAKNLNGTNGNSMRRKMIEDPSPSVFKSVYDSLQLNMSGLSRQAYELTMKGIHRLQAQGKLVNDSIVTIVDFSKPSSEKRLFIIDTRNYRVLFNTWVAHGRNSGMEWAQSFSNGMSSLKSSLGFYRTGETYMGGNGYSLKLQGLEKGINDKAMDRAIVLHGADYVSPDYLQTRGFMGRSWGCPAVSREEAYPIINTIKGGTCLFIYSPDKNYFSHSALLREA